MAKKAKSGYSESGGSSYEPDDEATTSEEVTEIEPAVAEAEAETCTYTVVADGTTIDGVTYNAGDTCELSKDVAANLQKHGVQLTAVDPAAPAPDAA